MRKRLYQPLPEHTEFIDNVNSACKEKTKKRFYAEIVVEDHDKKGVEAIEYFDSLSELMELTAKQLESLYTFSNSYEKEYIKIPLAIASNWNLTATTSIKFFELYMHAGKIAWENGLTYSLTPFSWASYFPNTSNKG